MIRAVEMFGQTRPMVVDEKGTILVGNGLYEALMKMGRTEGTVLRMKGLTKAAKAKLMLSDNRIFHLGADDYDNIMAMVRTIGGDGVLDIPGYDDDILKTLLAGSDAITDAAMDSFGTLTEEEIAARQRANVTYNSTVTCPHCGETFSLTQGEAVVR